MAKVKWEGMADGTPSSNPQRDPTEQKDVVNKIDWRGENDGTPSSSPETNPMKGGQ